MQNAIDYNAKAMSKMEAKDYEGAFNLLRACMLSITGPFREKFEIKEDHVSEKGIILVSTMHDPDLDRFYSGSFIFTVPRVDISKRQIDYCSAVCLYNMALACQLEYELTTDIRTKTILLAQSRLLYLTAYEFLQKYTIRPCDNIILLVMSLSANLIEIELELGHLSSVHFWRYIFEAASLAADPLCFMGCTVFTFFNSVYVPPGQVLAAKAA